MDAEEHPEEQRRIEWYETPVPSGMLVTQAYVWALDPDDGRILIQDRGPEHPRRYTLPGGRPEPEDGRRSAAETAAREAMEESQVRIDTGRAVYMGHQVVTWPVKLPSRYAQVRYAAPIIGYEPIGPDPDTGTVNRRFMTSLERAPELLDWHETGASQAKAALQAGQQLGLPGRRPGTGGLPRRREVPVPGPPRLRHEPGPAVPRLGPQREGDQGAGRVGGRADPARADRPVRGRGPRAAGSRHRRHRPERDRSLQGQAGCAAWPAWLRGARRAGNRLRQAAGAARGQSYLVEIGEDGYRTRQVVEPA